MNLNAPPMGTNDLAAQINAAPPPPNLPNLPTPKGSLLPQWEGEKRLPETQDPDLARQLGAPLTFSPIQQAQDRREDALELKRGAEQLVTEAAQRGAVLSLQDAARQILINWRTAKLKKTPTGTPSPDAPVPTAPPQTPSSISSSTVSEPPPTTPQKTPDSPVSPSSPEQPLTTPTTLTNMSKEQASQTVTPTDTTPQSSLPAQDSAPPNQTPPDTARIYEDFGLTISSSPTATTVIADPPAPNTFPKEDQAAFDLLLAQWGQPDTSTLSSEMAQDAAVALHPSTAAVQRSLQLTNAFRHFHQSLPMLGMPGWSKWREPDRLAIKRIYAELSADVEFVDAIVRRFTRFTVNYGATRLARMAAIWIGFYSWALMEEQT